MLDLELDWGSLLSTAGGGSLALAFGKALITKALRDLENVTKKLNETLSHISAIYVKLDEIDKINNIIHIHDRAISKLEAYYEHEQQARLYKNNSHGMRNTEN